MTAVDKSGKSDIINMKEKFISSKGENDILKLSSKFVNHNDQLYVNADKIVPLDGFSDIVCHGSPNELLIYGLNGEEWSYSAKEAAEIIRNSNEFDGKSIRLISCSTGNGENCIAQKIADELGVNVLAPNEIVSVDVNGEIFVSDNDVLINLWNEASEKERKQIHQTGKWIEFKPRKK